MSWLPSLMVLVGGVLSSLFSGFETGFYRVTRTRLLLSSLDGSRLSGVLLWLVQQPVVFVATTLIGNNLANYLLSLGLVMLAGQLLGGAGEQWGALMPILLSPLVFIYCELLPKHLFYQMPFRLLTATGPVFVLLAIFLVPLSGLLMLVNRLVERWSGGGLTLPVPMGLARHELQTLFREGQAVGILSDRQRDLAENLLVLGGQPISRFCVQVRSLPQISRLASSAERVRLAAQQRQPYLLVVHERSGEVVGYHRRADLLLADEAGQVQRSIVTVSGDQRQVAVLTMLHDNRCDVARVVDSQTRTLGLVLRDQLTERMLRPS